MVESIYVANVTTAPFSVDGGKHVSGSVVKVPWIDTRLAHLRRVAAV